MDRPNAVPMDSLPPWHMRSFPPTQSHHKDALGLQCGDDAIGLVWVAYYADCFINFLPLLYRPDFPFADSVS